MKILKKEKNSKMSVKRKDSKMSVASSHHTEHHSKCNTIKMTCLACTDVLELKTGHT